MNQFPNNDTAPGSLDREQVELFRDKLLSMPLFQDQSVEGSARWHERYYVRWSACWRWSFRIVGLLILLVAISTPPVLTLVPAVSKGDVAIALSWALALLVALNGFFNLQSAWRGHIESKLRIGFALRKWELEQAHAMSLADTQEAIKALHTAATRLLASVEAVVMQETDEHFKGIQLPTVSDILAKTPPPCGSNKTGHSQPPQPPPR
jgi:hypothetical protein